MGKAHSKYLNKQKDLEQHPCVRNIYQFTTYLMKKKFELFGFEADLLRFMREGGSIEYSFNKLYFQSFDSDEDNYKTVLFL